MMQRLVTADSGLRRVHRAHLPQRVSPGFGLLIRGYYMDSSTNTTVATEQAGFIQDSFSVFIILQSSLPG
jgi:hypothetical protein